MLLRQSVFPKTRFKTLRYITCAGGALAKSSISDLQACLPGTEIYIMYGQTEASARLSYLDPADLPRKLGSIGTGISGVSLKVCREDGTEVSPEEVGEITAEGGCVMKGYWEQPEETTKVLKDDRLYTGDLATVDQDGFIYIVGRRSDIIKCGSYRVHPVEIEEALNSHPEVVESAVIGVGDTILGESIVAFVVPRPGCSPSQSELLHQARKYLPTFKLPRKVIFVTALPKTSSGKIKRPDLRDQVAAAVL
jgi:acyl-coenzyme A synthetase/AMP-(fatty) acid ligase